MNSKPNFFCIGTQKAGTTSLYDVLVQHPQIYLPKQQKELHFFNVDKNYNRGINWYLNSFFKDIENEKAVGEITPAYAFYENVPERIYNSFGKNIKFIFILRHPVDRAVSLYNMNVANNLEKLEFKDAVESENHRIQKGEIEFRQFSYMTRGYYGKQLKKYLEFFPAANFLLINFEDEFLKKKETVYRKIEAFLEVDQYNELDILKHSNSSDEKYNYIKLLNFLKKTKFLKLIGSLFLSEKLLNKMKTILHKKSKANKKFVIDNSTKTELLRTYFQEDIESLNYLTDNHFQNWK